MNDFQRQKLYRAEWRFEAKVRVDHPDKAHLFKLTITDEADCWAVVDQVHDVLVAGGFPSKRCATLSRKPRLQGGMSYRWTGRIDVSLRTSWFVLAHEQCHLAVPNLYPGHGLEFVAAEVAVLDTLGLGDHFRRTLEESKVYWAYGQRAKEVRAKAMWLLRPQVDRHMIMVVTQPTSPLGIARIIGRAERTKEGVTFVERSGAGNSGPIMVPYADIAYVEAV